MDTLIVLSVLFIASVTLVAIGVVLYQRFHPRRSVAPQTKDYPNDTTSHPPLPDTPSTEPTIVDTPETASLITGTADVSEKVENVLETKTEASGALSPDVVPFQSAVPRDSVPTPAILEGEGVEISQAVEAETLDALSPSSDLPTIPVPETTFPTLDVEAEPETAEIGYKEADLSEGEATAETISAHPPTPQATTKRSPVSGGGRPRGSRTKNEDESEHAQKKRRILRPEAVCWKEARRWFIGIEMPEDIQEHIGLIATQNDNPLTQDDKGRWVLTQITGKVSVGWDEADHPVEIDLGDKPYLLLKLTGQTISRGRFVRYATLGWFLVVVPDQWQRDEKISEPASILPESVFLSGYQAHYFSLVGESNQKIAFRTPEGESVMIPTRAPRFELVGTRLPDATENIGPLFGEGPPRIRALDPNGWSDVGTIIVGQEGPGRGRWRKDFSPEQDCIEQEFPKKLSERCSGWYFIRFFDADDRLIESQDFRFVNALKEIRISPHSALPSDSGHLAARVEFLHDKGCIVELADSSAENLSVEYEHERTSTIIPPDPIWDETRWLIQAENGAQVEAMILVERVWWTIGEEGMEEMTSKWTDTPLNISRDLVTATSKQTLHFRLPRSRWVKEIRVGFEQWRARAYPVEVAKREVTIPLGDLGDMKEFEDRWQEHLLKLWIKDDANQSISAVVAVIRATQPPFIKTGRVRANVRRMRNYLKRLRRRSQDSALRQMISEAREKWSASGLRSEAGSYRIETSCVIALAWEILRANEIKPPGRRKRWIRELVRLSVAYPDIMQGVRENYEALKDSPASASSRPKR